MSPSLPEKLRAGWRSGEPEIAENGRSKNFSFRVGNSDQSIDRVEITETQLIAMTNKTTPTLYTLQEATRDCGLVGEKCNVLTIFLGMVHGSLDLPAQTRDEQVRVRILQTPISDRTRGHVEVGSVGLMMSRLEELDFRISM